jgi:hypothetical protein
MKKGNPYAGMPTINSPKYRWNEDGDLIEVREEENR